MNEEYQDETSEEQQAEDQRWKEATNEDGEYRSGFWTGALAGLEVNLPHRYTIGIEMIYFNSNNFIFVAGVSQTGILTW